jgi:Uma2 family endonuclease
VTQTVRVEPEQRVVLRNASWELYQSLLESRGDAGAPRFAYDWGMLEITSPGVDHEETNRTLAQIVELVALGSSVDVRNLGSSTFDREDLDRGFEPDSCFYVRNEERVRGKGRIDLAVDPPPDLVIEVDMTSPSLNKLPIYAALGVPEVWRYRKGRVHILELGAEGYVEAARSRAFPILTADLLSSFLTRSKTAGRAEWSSEVLGWTRERTRRLP